MIRRISFDHVRYGLTTAEILYYRPDHEWLLQTFVWQQYDFYPDYPVLRRFLEFWRKTLDGPLHSVTVAHTLLENPATFRAAELFTLQ